MREIVRDIIQENRVLGPAKFTLQELTSDQFFEHNPLGSIARDPQSFLAASSNENHPELNNLLDTSGKKLSVSDGYYTGAEHEEVDKGHVVTVSQGDFINKETIEFVDKDHGGAEHLVVDKDHVINDSQVDETNNEFIEATVVSDGHYTGAEQQIVDKGQVINGSQVDVINKESSEAPVPEMLVSEPMAPKQNEQELATAATPMSAVTEDLIVETFPIRPVARTTDGTEALGELRGSSNSPDNDIKVLELEKGQEMSELDGIDPAKTSNLLDEKFEEGVGNQILKKNTGQDEEKSLGDTLAESGKESTCKEPFGHEFKDGAEPQVGIPHQNTITIEAINQSLVIDGAKVSFSIFIKFESTYL